MMLVIKELVLEEGAFISYWKEDNINDITTVYSVDELKAHLGNLNDDEFEKLVIQVNLSWIYYTTQDNNLSPRYRGLFSVGKK